MFEKRDYRMYKGVKREKVYPQICDFWSRQGFYVGQVSPFQISGESFHQNIGLRREFYLRLDEHEGDTYIDLQFRAKISDEGVVGGVAAAVIFWPVAVVGGALSYSEYEKDANNLMYSFWGYVDQITDQRGEAPTGVAPTTPPAPPPGQRPPSQDTEYCTECGALLPKEWKACPYCGKVKVRKTKKDSSKAQSGRKPETPRKI